MRLALIMTLVWSAGIASFAHAAHARDAPKAADQPRKMAVLCVRTAPKGYVVLEARLMQSSGDPQFDAVALKDAIGSAVPMLNQRMWFEWLWTGWSKALVGADDTAASGVDDQPVDLNACKALDREARRQAGMRLDGAP